MRAVSFPNVCAQSPCWTDRKLANTVSIVVGGKCTTCSNSRKIGRVVKTETSFDIVQ